MYDELWSEIADAPGEIFDLLEVQEEQENFDFDGYLAADYDYWIMTLIISAVVIVFFGTLFYAEDRDQVGPFDPNSIHSNNKWLLTLLTLLATL